MSEAASSAPGSAEPGDLDGRTAASADGTSPVRTRPTGPLSPRVGDLAPWPAFSAAAHAATKDLHARFGWDLWLVTHVDGPRQLIVASAGPWSSMAVTGFSFPWEASFCVRMVHHDGPLVVPDVLASPEYAPIAVGTLAPVRAYAGVPLLADDGHLFGTLCAISGEVQRPSSTEVLAPARLLGQMLSTIVHREHTAAARSAEAAAAYALAERDSLTGLVNRRGWDAAIGREEHRARRYGEPVSVVVADLDGLKSINDTRGHDAGDAAIVACAGALAAHCRPNDILARLGGDEFAVLASHCDHDAAVALTQRLRDELRATGVEASIGYATRGSDEDLHDTWARADMSMYEHKPRGRR